MVVLILVLIRITVAEVQPRVFYFTEEEIPLGTTIGNFGRDSKLHEEYPEFFDQLEYSILSQVPPGLFGLEDDQPVLMTLNQVDRDVVCPNQEQCTAEVNIKVGPSEYFHIIQVEVEIIDLNDNVPVFPESEIDISLPESSHIGSRIALSTAYDPDSPINAIRRYSLEDPTLTFGIDVVNNTDVGVELYIVLRKQLDRESQEEFRMNLLAFDGYGPTAQSGTTAIKVTVQDVNDNVPVFQRSAYEFSVEEQVSVDSLIGTVKADDLDIGENAVVVYSIPSSTVPFRIDSASGEIFNNIVLDHEEHTSYVFTVKASNEQGLSLPASARISVKIVDINDNAPVISIQGESEDDNEIEIPEGANTGSFVSHFTVADADSEQNGEYQCTLNFPQFQLIKLFDSQYKITTMTSLDREAIPFYDLKITCEDDGEPKLYAQKTLPVAITDINDNAPQFSQLVYLASITENAAHGTSVFTASATDPDAGSNGQVVYSIDDPTNFTIDPQSGFIRSKISLDREEVNRYALTAYATSIGRHPTYGTAQIHIYIADKNDQPPVLYFPSEYNNAVHIASLPADQLVARINATDHDVGTNALLSYYISGEDAFMFRVDESSGAISTRVDLDKYEQQAFFVTVVVRDHGDPPLTAQGSISIIVNGSIPFDPVPLSSRQNRTILLIIVGISAVAMVMLLLGIAA
uniref:Cadherin domain-containing protein n=1 Tax=Capitella teleta TaxID=283909 RepID=X2B9U4_CAPTE